MTAMADMATLVDQLDKPTDHHVIYRRAQQAFMACQSVLIGTACLSRVGAAYLGVPYQSDRRGR
jgi:hypothetical protein